MRTKRRGVAAAVAIAVSVVGVSGWVEPALAQDAAGECRPSKWGAGDEIGAAHHVTPEQVKTATGLVKQGQVHPLGIVIAPKMPAYSPRHFGLEVVQPGQQGGKTLEKEVGWPMSYNDDIAQLWFGIGPQLDGLGHLGESDTYYNCNKGTDFAAIVGLSKLGIHMVPPLVGRGVMIDMARHFNIATLEKGQGYTADDIRAAATAQGVEIRRGDVVLFHTGWTDAKLASEPDNWVSGEPGITNDGAQYLASLDVMAVGSDTWGLGAVPPVAGDRYLYDHAIFLKDNGIYILETMNTGRLAAERVHEFMFVLGQARVQGAVQMMVNPVAMW